jgi:hypothetical protein
MKVQTQIRSGLSGGGCGCGAGGRKGAVHDPAYKGVHTG